MSVPAVSGAINGTLPTIDVAGAGTSASPWNLTLNTDWVDEVANTLGSVGAWANVTFENSWADYHTGTYGFCQYRKVGDMVQVRGLINGGVTNTTAFTLPVGFRPPFTTYGWGAISSATPVVGLVIITAAGLVQPSSAGTIADGFALQFQFSTTS